MSPSNTVSNTSSASSSNIGVIPVESVPYHPGASSPQQSAILYRQSQVEQQNKMNKVGGKQNKRKHRGGANIVPSFSTPGPPVGSAGQSATGSSVEANTSLTQGSANAFCDKCYGDNSSSAICQGPQCNPTVSASLGQKGGTNCGGNMGLIPNGQTWGCLSGGKRKSKKSKKSKTAKKSKKSKKSKTSKKSKKSKRSKKSKK